MDEVSRDSVSRAALGISLRYFARLCRQYEMWTPHARHRRHIQKAKQYIFVTFICQTSREECSCE